MRQHGARTEQLNIRLSMRERGELQTVAEAHGLTVASLIRSYVKRELRALAAEGAKEKRT